MSISGNAKYRPPLIKFSAEKISPVEKVALHRPAPANMVLAIVANNIMRFSQMPLNLLGGRLTTWTIYSPLSLVISGI